MRKKYLVSIKDYCKEQSIAEVEPKKGDTTWNWSKYFMPFLLSILLFAFLGLAVLIIYINFYKTKNIATAPIKMELSIVSEKDAETYLASSSAKQVLQETALQAFYQGRQKAQEEYDKNFTTLLTILTIFGIAWPVIIALLQFKFSEKELVKIEKANDNAEESLKQVKEIIKKNKKIEDSIKNLSTENAEALGNAFDGMAVLYFDEWSHRSKQEDNKKTVAHLIKNAIYCDFQAVFQFAKANNKKQCLRSIARIKGKADKLENKLIVLYDINIIADCLGSEYSKFEDVYNAVCEGTLSSC